MTKMDERAKSCRAGYKKALSAAKKERRKSEVRTARIRKAEEKAWLKEEERWKKIREAEGELIELPAVVLRDGTVKHVDLATALELIDAYQEEMCLDVETSGFDLGHRKFELRTIQLGGEEMAVVLDALDPLQCEIASYGLKAAQILHAHSAMADLSPCIKYGLIDFDSAWDKMVDSVLIAKLTDPKMSGSDANGLKDLSQDLLKDYATAPAAEKQKNSLFKAMGCLVDVKWDTPPERNGWNMVNRFSETMIRYAGSDVLDLAAVIRVLPPLPVDKAVLNRERQYQKICAHVNVEGALLDSSHIKEKIREHEKSQEEHKSNIHVLSDGLIDSPSSPDTGEKILSLYPGVELAVSEKTGKPSADKKSLAGIAKLDTEEGILAREILAYRHDVTTLGLLLRPLEILCDEGDSRMRPTVLTINAATGRSSTVRPNSSQFSRQGGIRKCVIADEGYVRFNADFQGCEIRTGAALSGDKDLLEAETSPNCWLCDSDSCNCEKPHTGLHWMAAHLTFGKGATKENRYKSKSTIFEKLFGARPHDEISEKIANVFDTQIAPEYAEWDKWLRDCYYRGRMVYRDYSTGENYSVDIPDRQKYMIYQAFDGRNIYSTKGAHAAGNSAIQGTARELLVIALIYFYNECQSHPEWGVKSIIPIHDEILGFCREEYFYEVTEALKRAMTRRDLSVPGFDVVIECDAETEPLTYWADSS